MAERSRRRSFLAPLEMARGETERRLEGVPEEFLVRWAQQNGIWADTREQAIAVIAQAFATRVDEILSAYEAERRSQEGTAESPLVPAGEPPEVRVVRREDSAPAEVPQETVEPEAGGGQRAGKTDKDAVRAVVRSRGETVVSDGLRQAFVSAYQRVYREPAELRTADAARRTYHLPAEVRAGLLEAGKRTGLGYQRLLRAGITAILATGQVPRELVPALRAGTPEFPFLPPRGERYRRPNVSCSLMQEDADRLDVLCERENLYPSDVAEAAARLALFCLGWGSEGNGTDHIQQ